jgi:hypothetical protein
MSSESGGNARLVRWTRALRLLIGVGGLIFLAYWSLVVWDGRRPVVAELWIPGVAVAFALESLGTLFKGEVRSQILTIWSTTLLGASFITSGLAGAGWPFAVLGAVLVSFSYVLALLTPAVGRET